MTLSITKLCILCHYAECHISFECHYAVCRYAERRFALRRSSDCRSAIETTACSKLK
jgi:hypothetical protein